MIFGRQNIYATQKFFPRLDFREVRSLWKPASVDERFQPGLALSFDENRLCGLRCE